MSKKTKEPLFRVVKRPYCPAGKTVAIHAAALCLASVLLLIFMKGVTDLSFGELVKTIVTASTRTANRLKAFAQEVALLLLIAVGLAPAFKMRFWNIGAQGQVLMGGLMAAIWMYYLRGTVPAWLMIFLCLTTSLLIAGLWCFIPAFFQSKYGANETLFTLMMNYIAIQLVCCFTHVWKGPKSAFGVMDRFTGSKNGYLASLFGLDNGWTILVAVLVTVLMFFYLSKTTHGYEISVVGESVKTARYAGINDKQVILRTAFFSGAICGLVGFLYVTNISHTISPDTGGSYGFTAIIVAWLAEFKPWIMALISALLIFVNKGAGDVRNLAGLDNSVCDVAVCIFLFCILGCGFFTRYRLVRNRKKSVKE